jgi:hypothetical protein
MSESEILKILAEKSGLACNPRLINRANEMQRLVQAQGCLGPGASLGTSATAMAVICLHLVSQPEELF